MNLGRWLANRNRVIPIFTWGWIIVTLVGSWYFAFRLYPKAYAALSDTVVPVYFLVRDPSKPYGVIYYPNTREFRRLYLKSVSDNEFLYYSACDILPPSQRPYCDVSSNWKMVHASVFNCVDVKTCEQPTYTLSEWRRNLELAGISTKGGQKITIDEKKEVSLKDPVGWGYAARWPLFFIFLFFGVKLGRAIGEFLFQPYKS